MTTFNFARILTGAATAAVLTAATLSGSTDALAHGGGMAAATWAGWGRTFRT
jgi:hypothetical protein